MRALRAALSLLAACFTTGLAACAGDTESIAREDHFALGIGRLEGELDLYNLQGARSLSPTGLVMRDGLFSVANGNGQKVVRYNSYGDLLFMIYNAATNPPPLTLPTVPDAAAGPSAHVTRWAVAWPLQNPTHIAVDGRKCTYVVDELPPERHSFDANNKSLLDSTVLLFDEDGRFRYYLGQEGIGGTPFPPVDLISVSANDEIAVVCHFPRRRSVYWFDGEGVLLYVIEFASDKLPANPASDADAESSLPTSSLDSIAVDPDKRLLYVKIDYYHDVYDETTNTRSGREPNHSIVYTMRVEDGAYLAQAEVPFYEQTTRRGSRRETENLLYTLFGVSRGGLLFLYVPVETGYSLLLLRADGSGRQRRGLLTVGEDEMEYVTLTVSPDAIISALLADTYHAKFVWWRTDKLAGELSAFE